MPAHSATALRGCDEQILKVEPGAAEKRRKRMEVECEPHRFTIDAGKHDLRKWSGAKERLPQLPFRRDDLVRQTLELRKLADKAEDESDLMLLGRAHAHRAVRAHQPVLCRPCAIPPMLASRASKRSRSARSLARQRCSRSTCMRFIGST